MPPNLAAELALGCYKMQTLRLLLLTLVLVGIAVTAPAGGIPILDGRYSGGPATILTLTSQQIAQLESSHYIDLTHQQSNLIKKQTKVRVYKLLIMDLRKGETDCEDFLFNVGLRFSQTEIEVPHKYLVPPEKAKEIEERLNNL